MAGTIVEIARSYIEGQLSDIAQRVYRDMVSAVSPHSKSGAAVSALKVQQLSDVSWFIGADVGNDPHDGGLHLLFLNDGNGTGGIPKGGRKPKRPMPMTYGMKTPRGYAMHASNYKGIHFVEKIASKYR